MPRNVVMTLCVILMVAWTAGPSRAQEHVPDAHTLLLLHFNDSLVGAAGENPVVAVGTGYAPGIFGNGVNLPAGNRLTYATSGNIQEGQGTLEFWVKPSWDGNDGQGHLILTWGTWGGILMGKDGGNYWRIIVNRYGPGGNPEAGTGINVSSEWQAGEWHHCAFTWSSAGVLLYVDGELRSQGPVGFTLPNPGAATFQIGGEGTSTSLAGVVDELRISDNVRGAEEIFESFARGTVFTALDVRPDPVVVTEGFSALPQVFATRAGGQEYAVPPAGCAWAVADTTIATVDGTGRIHGRSAGTTGATCVWHGLTDAFMIQVEPALPAPEDLAAEGFYATARLHWSGVADPDVAGYEVQRRLLGGAFATVKRVLSRTDFTDYGLTHGQTYEYQVCAIDAGGMQLTPYSPPCAVTPSALATSVSRHKNMEVLVAIYTEGYTSTDISRMIAGLEKSMTFYWRTSGEILNMDPTWLILDAPLPASEWGAAVEADLRTRGVQDGQYDLAYLIGNTLSGCLGGWVMLGSTCAAQGTVCGVPYPENIAGVDYTIAWTYTHEIHHALETMENITGDATPEVLFCHFPWCYPDPLGGTGQHMDWGTHYNGIGLTNREYGTAWMSYPAPYDGVIECADVDQDGMPDSDSRVWQDEARFGSSAARADSDGDGLSDLAEYCRYDFRGTDPNLPDTDGDGILDGIDPEPLYKSAEGITKFATPPVIDGVIESSWVGLAEGYYYTQNGAPFALKVWAGWTDSALYLAFESSRQQRFMVSIDGSGQDGRFESPVRHAAGTTDTNNPDTKDQQFGDSWGDGNHIYFSHGVGGVEVWGRSAITGAQVASTLAGGIYRTEVKIPATLPAGAAYTWYPPGTETPVVNGLTLAEGSVLGLNVTMSNFSGSDGNEFSGTWTSLFETHAYVDFVLETQPANVDEPVVARVPGFYFTNPYPRGGEIVLRAGADERVEVALFDVLGRRVRALRCSGAQGELLHFVWDGTDEAGAPMAAGVYYLRARCGAERVERKLVFLDR